MLLCELSVAVAKAELKAAKQAAGSIHQGIPSHLKARIEKAEAAVKAAKQEAEAVAHSHDHDDESREFHNNIAKKQSSETPQEKQNRYIDNIKKGQEETKGLNNSDKITDSLDTLAAKVYAYVKQASNDGAVKITGADIADHFNKPVTSVNRWLTKPAFIKAARLMGRR